MLRLGPDPRHPHALAKLPGPGKSPPESRRSLNIAQEPVQPPPLPAVDYSRRWYAMASVGMGIVVAALDGSIVNVALPTLVRAFDTDLASVEWVVLAYLLATATLMLSMGRLGDMLGKKPVYITGFIIFTIGSVLCGLAPTIGVLVMARVLQAVGAAMLMALGMAIVTEAFPPKDRGAALGISGALVSVSIVLGPTLGGILVGALSWHWIFIVNLPIGILGTIMAVRFIPATPPCGRQRFDYPGAATLFIGLVTLLLGLTLGQSLGFLHPVILGLFTVAVVFVVLFARVEIRSEQPMVSLGLFRNSHINVNLITGLSVFISTAAMSFLAPFYLQGMLGYPPAQAGLLMMMTPVAAGILSPISGRLSDRFGTRPIATAGLAFLTLGFAAVTTLDASTTVLGYLVRFLPVGIGIGMFQSPNNSAVMGEAPRSQLGVVSGLLSLTRTLGQLVGIAIAGALWSSRTAAQAGMEVAGGAPASPVTAQIAGLQDVFVAIFVLMVGALSLGVWALANQRHVGEPGGEQAETAAGLPIQPNEHRLTR
jgi:EmrB/QacA subfamily drug resistance transporter